MPEEYWLIHMTQNYVPLFYIVQKLKREKTILLSAILVSWPLSWNIVGSLHNPKEAASSLCTMTSAKKRTTIISTQMNIISHSSSKYQAKALTYLHISL